MVIKHALDSFILVLYLHLWAAGSCTEFILTSVLSSFVSVHKKERKKERDLFGPANLFRTRCSS